MVGFGVALPTFGPYADGPTIVRLIRVAEELGYDDVWFADHIAIPGYAVAVSGPNWFDPLACCAVGMGATTRLRFGTDVLVAPYRNPLVVAKLAASADRLGGGRLTLGVGIGYLKGEFEALGSPPVNARGAATDEWIEIVRSVFEGDGSAISYDGKFWNFSDVYVEPTSLQQPLPIWVGGNQEKAYRRAARLGTGWHPLFPTPELYAVGKARINELRGDVDSGFAWSYSCPETRVLFSTSENRPPVGYADFPDIPSDFDYAPPFPTAPDGRALFTGVPEQVIDDVAAFVEAGAEHFALRFWTGDPDMGPAAFIEQMARFADRVAPSFA